MVVVQGALCLLSSADRHSVLVDGGDHRFHLHGPDVSRAYNGRSKSTQLARRVVRRIREHHIFSEVAFDHRLSSTRYVVCILGDARLVEHGGASFSLVGMVWICGHYLQSQALLYAARVRAVVGWTSYRAFVSHFVFVYGFYPSSWSWYGRSGGGSYVRHASEMGNQRRENPLAASRLDGGRGVGMASGARYFCRGMVRIFAAFHGISAQSKSRNAHALGNFHHRGVRSPHVLA